MSDQNFASAVETLIGGTVDTFVVCAGAGNAVAQKTVAQVKTLLGLAGNNTGDQDLSSYATRAYADSLVVGLLDDRGNYDASINTFPATGGSGTAGTILKGDLWTISVAGTLGGTAVTAGDLVRALVDSPGQTTGNWAVSETNLGYTALNASLASGKIYVGNGSGIGTAVTFTGDVTVSNAGVTAIGASKVTNLMLAGSISASKLVGNDIVTVGTVTSGVWSTGAVIGGCTMTLGSDATGDIYYRNAGGLLTRLAVGTNGQVLTLASGLPSWAAASGSASWSYATGTDAATAMTVNTWYNVDMSAWATADRVYSLPTTAAVGDRVAVYITAGNTTTFELDLRTTSGSSDTIKGVDCSTNSWSRLFITGELVIFECTVANTNWAVIHDGRIPCHVTMNRPSAKTGCTNATDTEIDGYSTPSLNVGNIGNASNGRITARRIGSGNFVARSRLTYTAQANVSSGSICIIMAKINGANDAQRQDNYEVVGAASVPIVTLSCSVDLQAGDYVSAWGLVSYSGGSGTFEIGGAANWNYPRLEFVEVLS